MLEAERPIPIVGINATPEGVAAIKAGDLLASASFDAMKMACLAVETALRALRGETAPAEILLPVEVVDRATAAPGSCPTRNDRCRNGHTTWATCRLVGAPGSLRTMSRPRSSSILSHRIISYCVAQHRWAIGRHSRRLERRCLENERCLGRAG
jgi:hypothetical protein